MRSAVLACLLVSCGARPRPAAPTTGAIAGSVRSFATGQGVANARIVLRRPGSLAPVQGVSDTRGSYRISELPPGRYEVTSYVDRVPIDEQEVDVSAGVVATLDFAVGAWSRDAPIELNAPTALPLWRFNPPGSDLATGVIEGTVADVFNRERLAGAVVSIVLDGAVTAEQAVTDDEGRFRVPSLAPGRYAVSAYYALVGRGQFEVRRSDVAVTGGSVVVVPLWLETK